jgi:hypothetical protein
VNGLRRWWYEGFMFLHLSTVHTCVAQSCCVIAVVMLSVACCKLHVSVVGLLMPGVDTASISINQ